MSLLTRYNVASLLLGLSLFGGCKSSDMPPLTGELTLKQTESGRISNLAVRVDTLSDSRCPAGLECFWEGIAFVSATVSNGSAQQRVRLYLNSQSPRTRQDSAGVTLSSQTYKVILKGVAPYPARTYNPDQQAVINVTKL